MPKIKTHKATAKRFRRTGTGKLVCRHQGRGHLRRNKSPRTLIAYRKVKVIDAKAAEKRVSQLAPSV
ncbi:MAG: large ribosomal subunit protein bL35 [Anaerolineae bacterium]